MKFFAFFALLLTPILCQAVPNAGAARTLRLVAENGAPLDGDLTEPVWTPNANALYFTRESGNTRNIWRATPDTNDKNRYPIWRATPVTRFEPPFYAAQPMPAPDGRSLILVTNAVNVSNTPKTVSQIARLELRSGSLRALTGGWSRNFDPAISPDGQNLAFVSDRAGFEALYVLSLSGAAGERRLASEARSPFWLDDDTLVFSSTRPGARGLYRIAASGVATTKSDLVFSGIGELAAMPSGDWLALAAADSENPQQTGLYILAADGSGLRVLNGTTGARHPNFAPDGEAIVFDAPLGEEPNAPRAIWLVQLVREAPVARLKEVRRATEGALAIIGTAQSSGKASLRLEIGQGENPKNWTALPAAPPPLANAPIALWQPPRNADGLWLARLTITDSSGASDVAILPIRLPLAPEPPPAFVDPPAPRPTPVAPISSGQLPILPVPALPPAPNPVRVLPPSMPNQPPQPVAPPPQPIPVPKPTPTPAPVDSNQPKNAGDSGKLNVVGTLAEMSPGQSASVAVWVQNTGSRVWGTDKNNIVRLVARWVDFDSNTRRKWNYQWLRGNIEPGQSSRWTFDLSAPTRPGRYKLIYGLVRFPENGKYDSPAFNARQEKWPGEFAAIAFAVTVK